MGVTDMDVFSAFANTNYVFLQIARGGVRGNTIEAQFNATGVFKLRSDLVRGENSETKDSNATLHVRPTESFLAANDNNLIGHGVRVNGKDYEVIGQTGGMNYQTGVLEHYTATLQESDFSSMEGSGES